MTSDDIKRELQSQLAILNQTIKTATLEADRLSAALAALEGTPPPKPSGPPGIKPTPVADLILEAAKALPTGATFDARSISIKAQVLFPSQQARVKTGVYTALSTLTSRKLIRKTMGGWEVAV